VTSGNPFDLWLSVVTVVRNDVKGFESTIISLQGQVRDGVEFIVVDGSSDPDEIPRVLEQFSDLNAIYKYVQPTGVYPAMNVGLELARGEYILFANAGDSFTSGEVLGHMRKIVEQRAPFWIVGRVCIVDVQGHSVITDLINFSKERSRLFARGKFPPHQATIARVKTLRSLGGFSGEYSVAADYHVALKLGEIAPPHITDQVLMAFSEGGLSTQQWQKSFGEFHRARQAVYAPRGVARWVELSDTYWHYFRVWVFRNIFARYGSSWRKEGRP